MKLLCGIFFSVSSLCSIAQQNINKVTENDFSPYSDQAYQPSIGTTEKIKALHIKTQTTVQTYKCKMTWKKIENFDPNGNMIRQQIFSTNSMNSSDIIWQYNEQNQLISVTTHYDGHPQVKRYFYNLNGSLTETRGYDREGNYYGRKKIYAPINNKIISELLFKIDSINPAKKMNYEYYDDGSKKSMNYFVADELVYSWTFECGEEGKIIDLKKSDSSLVCIKEEIDTEGRQIIWRHEFNSYGYPVKIKTIKQNNLALSETKYNSKNEIISEMIYFKDGGYMLNYYNKKGRVYCTNESVYNIKGERIYSTFGFNPHLQKSLSDYKDGLISKTTTVTKNKVTTTEYSYTFY